MRWFSLWLYLVTGIALAVSYEKGHIKNCGFPPKIQETAAVVMLWGVLLPGVLLAAMIHEKKPRKACGG